jgi:hypothetical protein
MSRITLSGNASGTGNFTLASPNSNTDRTLTLPDATGTVVVSGATPELGGVYLGGSGSTNLLDDYEEGTFSLSVLTSGYTLSTNTCFYTKVGRVVTLQCILGFSAVAAANSGCVFTGIPFATANLAANSCQTGVARENSNTGAIYVVSAQSSTSNIELNSMDGVGAGQQRTIRTGEIYGCTITYITT